MPDSEPPKPKTSLRRGHDVASALDRLIAFEPPFLTQADLNNPRTMRSVRRIVYLDGTGKIKLYMFENGKALTGHGTEAFALLSKPLGIAISKGSRLAPIDDAMDFASAFLAMNLVPPEMSILCLDSRVIYDGNTRYDNRGEFASFIVDTGIAQLVYDDADVTCGMQPLVPPDDMKRGAETAQLHYYGHIPHGILSTVIKDKAVQLSSEYERQLADILASTIYVPNSIQTMDGIEYRIPHIAFGTAQAMVRAVSFGHLVLPDVHSSPSYPQGHVSLWLRENVVFHNEEDLGRPWEQPVDLDVISDVCRIWDVLLERSAITLKCNNCPIDKLPETIESCGRAYGVDSAIEAYFSGVPIEHILS